MNSFTLNVENFSRMHEELEPQLERLKINRRDILNTELLIEEIFWRMNTQCDVSQVEVRVVKNFFGKVQIRLTATGTPHNPLVEISQWSEEDYCRLLIIKSNRQKLNWTHKKNFNVVTINVRDESNRLMKLTFVAMAAGVVCGVFMNLFLSPETISFVKEDLMTPIETMFLNALNMVIAPVIFFSIFSGIMGMGESATVGKVGSKLVGLYMGTMVVAAALSLLLSMIFFQDGVPQAATIAAADNVTGQPYEFSLVKFIVDIIPNNLVSPIVDGNLLQVIFLAVLSGICLNALGAKVKLIQELVENCNEFFMKMVEIIVSFMPLIVFSAMMTLALDTNTQMIFEIAKLIFLQLFCFVVMIGVYMLLILFVGKITPLPFLKKLPLAWSVPFATSSSSVSMPFTMKFCTQKLGISSKISSFAIAIGTTVNMNGACIALATVSIMFLKMYGVEVDLNALVAILAMTVSMAIGMPAVPNAGVICTLTIVGTFGVPNDIAGLLFCIGALCDRPCTCFNVTGDIAAAFVLARTENMMDEKIYLGN